MHTDTFLLQKSYIVQKFASKAEKTGWTYIAIPAADAALLEPNNKKSFRVKGFINAYEVSQMALTPMGEGDFILALNASIRKKLGILSGHTIQVQLAKDNTIYQLNIALLDCLADAPKAKTIFDALSKSNQNYFSKWIDAAKTEQTQIKRITKAIKGLETGMSFGEMTKLEIL